MFSLLFICIVKEYLHDTRIVLFNYNLIKNDYNKYTHLQINNIGFRETGISSNFDGITAFKLKAGNYNFSMKHANSELTWKIFSNYDKIIDSHHTLNSIIISNNTLISHNYEYPKSHILHIAYQNVLPFSNNSIQFILQIDGFEYIHNSHNGYSIYKNITLQKGKHFIKISTKSDSKWCSCPSINDGFSNGRYFYAWVEPIDSHLNTIQQNISNYLPKLISINLERIFITI